MPNAYKGKEKSCLFTINPKEKIISNIAGLKIKTREDEQKVPFGFLLTALR